MQIFKLCSKYIRQHVAFVALYVFLCLCMNAVSIVTPYLMGNFIDNLISERSVKFLSIYSTMFFLLTLVGVTLGFVSNRIYIKVQTQMGFQFNKDIIEHVQRVSLLFTRKKDLAYLNQTINADTNGMIIFCLSIIQNILINITLVVIPLVLLLRLDLRLTIILCAFIGLYVLLYLVFKKPIFKVSFLFKEEQGKFFAKLQEQLKHIGLIKMQGIAKEMNERLNTGFTPLLKSALKYQQVSYTFYSLDTLIAAVARLLVFVLGGYQIIVGNFTVGMFTIFLSYFDMLLNAVKYFLNFGKSYQEIMVSYRRVMELLEQKCEPTGEIVLSSINKVEAKNLTFSYDRSKAIVNNFNAVFEKGKVYGIFGGNGTGKSTLSGLLLGLYVDEQQGTVLYNDIDINDIDTKYLKRELIGISEQHSQFVNDTIQFNIFFADASLSNEQCDRLCALSNRINVGNYLSTGNMSMMIDDFLNISGGEGQKISILRAIMKEPDLLILDEPTNSLDRASIDALIDYLKQTSENRITIIISHDDAIQTICDEVICLT